MLPTPRRPPPGTAGLAPNTGVCGVGRYVELGKKLGQAVVVDSRPGAGGSVGGLLVSQAPADGYTLMLSNSTPISTGPFALDKQPYDPVEGFTHIALIGSATRPSSPAAFTSFVKDQVLALSPTVKGAGVKL